MRPEQIAARLFLTIRSQVGKNDITTQHEVYQMLVDELEREIGRLEEEGSSEDERFTQTDHDDEDDGA